LKLVRTSLLGASLFLLALGGVAASAQAAENPVDPILCTVTSPDPSTCSADPGGGESGDEPESGDAPEKPGDEPGTAPTQEEPPGGGEDPLCGVTAGLVCAPGGGGGGEEPPGGPGGGGAEEPPSDPGESPSDPGESPSEDPGMGEDEGPSGPAGL
jgi:hypothetical protein